MKGVVLAGGTGSRLFPLTKVTNKHLLPVGQYPMIFHPVGKLAEVGIHEILVVTGPDHMGDIVSVLGSGRDVGLELTYRVQDRAGGIAEALSLAKGFVGDDRCVVILGDNIFEDSLTEHVRKYEAAPEGAMILLKEVADPERFGVPRIEEGKIVGIDEKPSEPASNYCVTGIYMYDSRAFEFADALEPSARGELEITDVNNSYVDRGQMTYAVLEGWWTDAGTFESLTHASQLAKDVRLAAFEATETHRVAR